MVMNKLKLDVDTILYRIEEYVNYVKPIFTNPESDVNSTWDLFCYGPSFIYETDQVVTLPEFSNDEFNYYLSNLKSGYYDWCKIFEAYKDLATEFHDLDPEEIRKLKQEILKLGYRGFYYLGCQNFYYE